MEKCIDIEYGNNAGLKFKQRTAKDGVDVGVILVRSRGDLSTQ